MASVDLSNLNYATVSDGTVYNNDGTVLTGKTDGTTSSLSSATDSNEMGYEQFLTLLCAEMQYQDPLEPTSNTEYVAQLATFSQLEATLSMKTTMSSMEETLQNSLTDTQQLLETNMANSLVGKYVIVAQTDSETGETTYVDGKVDYVMYDEDGNLMVSVADGLYPLSSLDTIADADYYEAVALSKSMENMLSQLPEVQDLTANYAKAVSQIRELYDGMTSYQQNYVSADDLSKLEAYEAKIALLNEAEEETETTEDTSEAAEETASTEAAAQTGEAATDAVTEEAAATAETAVTLSA
jgi:flagellar basal-body rod modification protein FlgD